MKNLLAKFIADEDGAAMVEYTILIGMITVAVIASIVIVAAWVTARWGDLATAL
ncbi:Flp family type IVb pilin (plasmid) [Mesorhizobium sp. AaZ16]|uniref:Flp family type IVb pilin n=1 Tax=Mesorhizobium sp. AaZ16 TaxID=3402289 RepID=UPI00374ECC7C